jgi:hypothetical protein
MPWGSPLNLKNRNVSVAKTPCESDFDDIRKNNEFIELTLHIQRRDDYD